MRPTGAPRVFMTLDAVGGVWQYSLDLARALGERGCQTILALLGPGPSASQRREADAIATATLIDTGLPLDWLCDGPEPVLAAGRAITALAGQTGADIVQLNMPTLAATVRPPMPTIAVTHGCVATWWEAAHGGAPLDAGYEWHRRLMAQGLRAVDHIIAPTASYARLVERQYRLPRLPGVVHNGRTPPAWSPRGALHDCALTVGRLWDRVKRADLLDRAASRMAIPFHAAGAVQGPHGERAALEHLHLLGQIDSDALMLRLAERPVFVSAASFEPFGLAVLEAANAGCALVLSDIPGFRELWDGAALFVAGDDDAVWARAIETVIHDADRRNRLGHAAHDRAARYTPAAMAEGMWAVFDGLRKGHQQGTAAA